MILYKHCVTVLLLGLIFTASKSVTADNLLSSQKQKGSTVPNMLLFKASEMNGVWLIDGQKLPIIKTSLTSENILTIENTSNSKFLNLVIPSLKFSVIAKNHFLFNQPLEISEENSGSEILWLEPMSTLTIAFRNDLADAPLQAIVSVSKRSKKVLAIFGPDQGGKFNLSDSTAPSAETVYSDYGFMIKNEIRVKEHSVKDFDWTTGSLLNAGQTFSVRADSEGLHIKFSEPVYVPNRNSKIGGSKFWTKNLYIYSNEKLEFLTAKKTFVIGAK